MTAFCPYGTYQRATSGLHLGLITPKILFARLKKKLKKAAQRGRKFREARHALYRGALEHLKNDLEIMKEFRL